MHLKLQKIFAFLIFTKINLMKESNQDNCFMSFLIKQEKIFQT